MKEVRHSDESVYFVNSERKSAPFIQTHAHTLTVRLTEHPLWFSKQKLETMTVIGMNERWDESGEFDERDQWQARVRQTLAAYNVAWDICHQDRPCRIGSKANHSNWTTENWSERRARSRWSLPPDHLIQVLYRAMPVLPSHKNERHSER